MHFQFIFSLLIISSYQNGFDSTWLDITELIPKNIENSQRIQIKKLFHIFVSARLRKHSADLSFDCWLFYPTELILTQHGSTLLNWHLKTLKTLKKFKQRNVSIFCECMFTKRLCGFFFWLSSILSYRIDFNSTWLNITDLVPQNIENFKKIQTKKRFHIFVSACLRKCTVDLCFDCQLFHPTELILTQHGSTLLNWCLTTLKTVKN